MSKQKRWEEGDKHKDSQGYSGAHKDSSNVTSYNEYLKQRANFDDPSVEKEKEAKRLKLEKAKAENQKYLKDSR